MQTYKYAYSLKYILYIFAKGLDPGGPSFKDKPKEGRLDVTDAHFVDNIHTNGEESLTIDFGIGLQIGDVDFVPNGGGIQPGCENRRKRIWFWVANTYKIATDTGTPSESYAGHGQLKVFHHHI